MRSDEFSEINKLLCDSLMECKIRRIIQENCNFTYLVRRFIAEGIDIDKVNKTVAYNDTHDNLVSTSSETNPTYTTEFGNYQVWSIFKRNKSNDINNLDGNPLLYAMKQENRWRFKTVKDRIRVYEQINTIINKFNSTHQYQTVVVVPSGGELNKFLGDMVGKNNPKAKVITDVFSKMTTQEVYEALFLNGGESFRKVYNTTEKFNEAVKTLENSFKEMNKKRKGYFTYHFIKDAKLRNTIEKSIILDDNYLFHTTEINGKDILIVDDSISRGNTIKEIVNIILSTFIPKSVTVLTLFSKI
jgi:hypothetical protein